MPRKRLLLCAAVAAAVSYSGIVVAAPKRNASTASKAKADPAKILQSVKASSSFDVTVFAAPPDVSYVTCLTAAPMTDVFIGIDETGSLGHQPNAGRVVRAVDTNGDGRADRFVTFATMDHPRGLVWDDGKLWVLHPPYLTLYTDNGTGVAGPGRDLVSGISTEALVKGRGADHTTNGIRMGIDGWIYIAMGDFGMFHAVTADGKPFQVHGGGVMRVRPDGTDLEIYSFGTRNIYDVAIDPFMNVFTRDNTNDGDNWNDRLAYDVPSGYYGYPSYFMHFPGEFIDCLADYGGGAPCGSIFLDEPNLPKGFFTVEWGRSEVDHHPLAADGANFKAGFEKFMTIPRGTDIDADGLGHLFVSSWANGGFSYSGPNVGFVVRVTPKDWKPTSFPDLHKASEEQLLEYLASPSGVLRQATQREILRRGEKPGVAEGLEKLAASNALLQGRAAAIFTIQQLLGPKGYAALAKLTADDGVREFALRALADRKGDASIPIAPFLAGLKDKNPRVRMMAAWGLNRLGRAEAIRPLMPLLADPDPIVAHVAMQSLIALHAVDACLDAVDPSNQKLAQGAVRVLQHFHEILVVEGLMKKSETTQDATVRGMIYGGLCRLYHAEAPWDGKWWGTRPDTRGPYYKPVDWDGTTRIGGAIETALLHEKGDSLRSLVYEVQRNGVDSGDVAADVAKAATSDPTIRQIVVDTLDNRRILTPDQVQLLGRVAMSDQESTATRVKALRALQYGQGSPGASDAIADALGAVLASPNAAAPLRGVLDDYLRQTEHASKIRQFEKLAESDSGPKGELAYAVLVNMANSRLIKPAARDAAQQAIDKAWDNPQATIRLLHAIALTKSRAYASKVEALRSSADPQVAQAASSAAAQLGGTAVAGAGGGRLIQDMPYDAVITAAKKDRGDAKLGKELFTRQGCVVCHTTSPEEPPKGPLLAGIAQRYSREELCESILKPSAKIAQGFETQWFKLKGKDEPVEGFVVRESGDQLEVRNITGVSVTIKASDIEKRGKRDVSVMPEGLVAQLTPHDLASILAYFESLKTN
ncbi:MAG TPA: HEAT repeat domain-containing protein [Tepidisphaeraceae bacterium]